MRFTLLIVCLTISSSTLFAQRPTQKKSYPPDIEKIKDVRASYTGCTLGPCHTWWSIALKDKGELLIQTGVQHPAGTRSDYLQAGKWKISGDTLRLKIDKEAYDPGFMRTEYRIASLYNCEMLLPLDSAQNWGNFLKEVKVKFEQSDYHKGTENQTSVIVVQKLFSDFMVEQYSTNKKFLVKQNNNGFLSR